MAVKSVVPVATWLVLLAVTSCAGPPDSNAAPGTTKRDAAVPAELSVGSNDTVPATMAVPDNYVIPDTRGVAIAPLIARPSKVDHSKPLLLMDTGTSKLKGHVFDPDGKPLEGATVRLQRFVSEDNGVLDLPTNKDGAWHADNLPGGRYRIRAWSKPSLATVEPKQLFLLADHDAATVDVALEQHDGFAVAGALDQAEPHVGQAVAFRAIVTQESVDDNGMIQGIGVPIASIQLSTTDAGLKIIGPDVGTSNIDGYVVFTVACLTTGDHSVIIDSSNKQLAIGLPTCLDGSLADLPPDTPVLAVDSTFVVPSLATVPPGEYTATNPGNCGTSYEQFTAGKWVGTISLSRTITLSAPARNFTAFAGSQGCTFKRTK